MIYFASLISFNLIFFWFVCFFNRRRSSESLYFQFDDRGEEEDKKEEKEIGPDDKDEAKEVEGKENGKEAKLEVEKAVSGPSRPKKVLQKEAKGSELQAEEDSEGADGMGEEEKCN